MIVENELVYPDSKHCQEKKLLHYPLLNLVIMLLLCTTQMINALVATSHFNNMVATQTDVQSIEVQTQTEIYHSQLLDDLEQECYTFREETCRLRKQVQGLEISIDSFKTDDRTK